MQRYNDKDKKLIYQNMFYNNNNFRRNAAPQGHQNSMNLNQMFKQFEPSRTSSDGKFEKERLNSKSKPEMFSVYIKSVYDNLLWLSKSLDVKRQELNRIFDDIIKWKFLNLRKQAQFLLENLIEKKEPSKNEKYQNFPTDKNTSNVLNIENIESGNATILSKKDKKNLNKTEVMLLSQETEANFNEINNKTRTMKKNITINQSSPRTKMRTSNYTELSKNKTKHRNVANAIEESATEKSIRIANTTNGHPHSEKKTYHKKNAFAAKTAGGQKRIASKVNKSKRTTNKSNRLINNGKQFGHSKTIPAVLPRRGKTGTKKNNHQKRTGTNTTLHGSSKKNVTDAATNSFRRTLQNSRHKSEAGKQIDQHDISGNNNITNRNLRRDGSKLQTKSATMDMIMEELDEILPPQKPAEKSAKTIS